MRHAEERRHDAGVHVDLADGRELARAGHAQFDGGRAKWVLGEAPLIIAGLVTYFIVTGIYLVLSMLLRQVLRSLGWWLFPKRVAR